MNRGKITQTPNKLKEGIVLTYVMGDIHGRFDKYLKLLRDIKFKNSDDLYVVGDMIDIGDKPCEVIMDMSMRTNVFPILGEHEYIALKVLEKMKKSRKYDETLMDKWIEMGGRTTIDGLSKLDEYDREALVDYLKELPLYEEIEVCDKKYILVHAGINGKESEMSSYTPDDLVFEKAELNKCYFKDKYLITGHRPFEINGKKQDKIIKYNGHISLNCGEDNDSPLCAIRLEDGCEYYA